MVARLFHTWAQRLLIISAIRRNILPSDAVNAIISPAENVSPPVVVCGVDISESLAVCVFPGADSTERVWLLGDSVSFIALGSGCFGGAWVTFGALRFELDSVLHIKLNPWRKERLLFTHFGARPGIEPGGMQLQPTQRAGYLVFQTFNGLARRYRCACPASSHCALGGFLPWLPFPEPESLHSGQLGRNRT